MSETNKKTTPTKDPRQRINELLEMGKQKGVLSYKEIMDALQELELDQEAVEKAQSYLKYSSGWTRSKLIDQLEFEGFTYSQAIYGVDHCGHSW